MNYETAKKLKDAGFPQKVTGDYMCQHCSDWDACIVKTDCEPVMIVSLSELIESCGDKIESIEFIHDLGLVIAYGENDLTEEGSSAEIAVANLWLALNKKDNR